MDVRGMSAPTLEVPDTASDVQFGTFDGAELAKAAGRARLRYHGCDRNAVVLKA